MVKDVNLKEQFDTTRETIESLGEQIKDLLEGVKAKISDYRFTVTSKKDGMEIEFFVKAELKKKRRK